MADNIYATVFGDSYRQPIQRRRQTEAYSGVSSRVKFQRFKQEHFEK